MKTRMEIIALTANCQITFTNKKMKVSVTEFVKDKVFFFLAPEIQKGENEKFKELVSQWMDKRVQNYSSPWHSEFVTYFSDGRNSNHIHCRC